MGITHALPLELPVRIVIEQLTLNLAQSNRKYEAKAYNTAIQLLTNMLNKHTGVNQ